MLQAAADWDRPLSRRDLARRAGPDQRPRPGRPGCRPRAHGPAAARPAADRRDRRLPALEGAAPAPRQLRAPDRGRCRRGVSPARQLCRSQRARVEPRAARRRRAKPSSPCRRWACRSRSRRTTPRGTARAEQLELVGRSEAVRLFVERAVAILPSFALDVRERARRRRDLPAARRHPARPRARGRAGQRPLGRGDRAGSRRPVPSADRRTPDGGRRASRRSRRSSTGAGTCLPSQIACCCAGCPSSPAAGRSMRPQRSRPAWHRAAARLQRAGSTGSRGSRRSTGSAASSIGRWSSSTTRDPPATGCSRPSASTPGTGWWRAERPPSFATGTWRTSYRWRATRSPVSRAPRWWHGWGDSTRTSTTCALATDWALETRPEVALELCVALGPYWTTRSVVAEGLRAHDGGGGPRAATA